MSNIILVAILVAHIIPTLAYDYIGDDIRWHLYHISLLIILLLQAALIYIKQSFKDKFTKMLSFVIMAASVWFLFDYIAITYFESYM